MVLMAVAPSDRRRSIWSVAPLSVGVFPGVMGHLVSPAGRFGGRRSRADRVAADRTAPEFLGDRVPISRDAREGSG